MHHLNNYADVRPLQIQRYHLYNDADSNIPYMIQPLFMQQRVESGEVKTTAWLRVKHKDNEILTSQAALNKEIEINYS